jgi:hypothetical protein
MTDLSVSKLEVSCSAGRGVLAAEDCLQCALDGYNECGYEYGLLRALFAGSDRTGIHVSDLLGCLKSAYLTKVDPQPEYVHEKLMKTLGTLVHSIVEQSDEYADAEVCLSALGIVGRADRFYKDGRLIDYKTTRWLYPSKLPYSSHGTQANIYAHLLRKMGREVKSISIQYIDMSGPTKCRSCSLPVRMVNGVLACPKCGNEPKNAHLGALLVDIPLMDEEEVEGLIVGRREELQAALDTGLTPMGEPSFLCAYCMHREGCAEAQ